MFTHNVKIAIRNLLKYRTPNLISIVGLGIGIAAFALATFWMRYELSFDDFHKDAARIYLLRLNHETSQADISYRVPYALGSYLQSHYAEVEQYAICSSTGRRVELDEDFLEIPCLQTDSSFYSMAAVRVVAGNIGFLQLPRGEEGSVAVTESLARRMFGSVDVIGRTIRLGGDGAERKVAAVVADWSGPTNFPFQMLEPLTNTKNSWNRYRYFVLVKLQAGTDAGELLAKMNRNFPRELKSNKYTSDTGFSQFQLTPLSELNSDLYFKGYRKQWISIRHIAYFALTGALIILCALVNYLTIYTDRFKVRLRELSLRKVCGAGEKSLFLLLATELLLTMALASLVGMIFVEWVERPFREYAQIEGGRGSLYLSCLCIVGVVGLVMLLIACLSVIMLRRKSMAGKSGRGGNRHSLLSNKTGVVMQVTICLGVVLATILIQMQLQHLMKREVGYAYENRAVFHIDRGNMEQWYERLKALPTIKQVLKPEFKSLLSPMYTMSDEIVDWEGNSERIEEPLMLTMLKAEEEYLRFYDFKLLAGEFISPTTAKNEVMLNRSAVRRMGWTPEEAVGKHLTMKHAVRPNGVKIIGVIEDCATASPASDAQLMVLRKIEIIKSVLNFESILFSFEGTDWETVRKQILQLATPEERSSGIKLLSEEQVFLSYLSAERSLSKLLWVASVVCILISMFGVYSLVTLTCERRRKEIAVRKVCGAKVKDILKIFWLEYLKVLAIGTLISFPVTYLIVMHWLQGYHRQVEIGLAPFLALFAAAAVIITLCIATRVWKAANENPAEVVKRE